MAGAEAVDPVVAIARSWWVILLTVLVGATAAAGVVATRPERFTTTATLLYSAGGGDDVIGGGAADPIRTLNTQVQLVTSDPVVVPAAEPLAREPGAPLAGRPDVESSAKALRDRPVDFTVSA